MTSIPTSKSSFVIFGHGYNTARVDSGKGEGARIFSHPFVPLHSRTYNKQYRLYVPDNAGNIINAPVDDIYHCTFIPELTDTFETEGETEVKIIYHREYTEEEPTIVVHKEATQKITVVDHGTVTVSATASYQRDIYSDGYIYWRPHPQGSNTYRDNASRAVTKSSSLPWGATTLGGGRPYYFITSPYLTDISELAFADVSGVGDMRGLFKNCYALKDISPLAEWEVRPRRLDDAFGACAISDISALANWDMSRCIGLSGVFGACSSLEDLSPLANWDTSNVLYMSKAFLGVSADISPLSGWNVSKVSEFSQMFSDTPLSNLDALANWDTSSATKFDYMFQNCINLVDIEGLKNWNVSKGLLFNSMFSTCTKLEDISPLADWDISRATSIGSMFYRIKASDISPLNNWDFSNNPTMTQMFYYSEAENPDASPAGNWNVTGSNKKAFSSEWLNIPSWN